MIMRSYIYKLFELFFQSIEDLFSQAIELYGFSSTVLFAEMKLTNQIED